MGGSSGTPGQVTITPVFWAPSGYSFPTTYKNVINGYLANVAAASQTSTNVFSVATQYYQQATATGSPIQHIQYRVTFGAEIDDANLFPLPSVPGGCTPAATFSACVADGSLQTELRARLGLAGAPIDDAHLYLVFFPTGVETCATPGNSTCSNTTYCAYHSGSTTGSTLLYANEPYPDMAHCVDPYLGPQAPNGDSVADAQVSLISHEASESITDSFNTWFDSAAGGGYENGDECAYVYGAAIASTGVATDAAARGTAYNQAIGTGKYWTQDEFSNQDFAAGTGDVDTTAAVGHTVLGCRQREELPTATFVAPIASAGAIAQFDGSGSSDPDNSAALAYSWTWGDTTPNSTLASPTHVFAAVGAFTVTLTVTDGDAWTSTVSQVVNVGPAVVVESLGGVITGAPATTSWAANRTDVFVRGGDSALWHRSWDGSVWSGWESLGGLLSSAPGAVSWGPNRMDVFGRGGDGALWHRAWTGSAWSDWQTLGGGLNSGPAVASWTANRLDIFARGTDNALWHVAWGGTAWSAWQTLGGGFTSDPAAVSWGPDHIDVFARGLDSALWQTTWTGSAWVPWTSRGGTLTSGPDVSSCASQHLDVYALGKGSLLQRLAFTGTAWDAWRSMGSQWTADPAAVCRVGTGVVDIFARGVDNALWHTTATGS